MAEGVGLTSAYSLRLCEAAHCAVCAAARRSNCVLIPHTKRVYSLRDFMAEGVGFEPTGPCGPPVFKTGAIDHSATPPDSVAI